MKVQQQNDGPELASVYSNLAIVNINLGRNAEAIEWLEKALQMYVLQTCLNQRSIVVRVAEQPAQHCVTLRSDTRVFGKYHVHVAKDHHYLGRLCHREVCRVHAIKQASILFSPVLDLRTETIRKGHRTSQQCHFDSCTCLGRLHFTSGQLYQ
jgi:tetratricopeptide (TPR) repeat protein